MTVLFHTDIAVSAPDNAATFNAPLGQLDSAINNLLTGAQAFTQLNLGSPTQLNISADTITITRSFHYLETEGAAAVDNLSTIVGGAMGDVLVLGLLNSTHQVIVKNGTGNILLAKGRDVRLLNSQSLLTLVYNASFGFWLEVEAPFSTFNYGPTTGLTISGDSITVTQSRHTVDTEGAAATDDLLLINGGVSGDQIQLSITSNARTVRMVSVFGGGNIVLKNRTAILLTDVRQVLRLTFTGVYWVEDDSYIEYAPRPSYRKFRSVVGAAAAFEVTNVAAVTASGTLTNGNDATTTWVNALTGAVAGNTGGFVTGTFNLCRRAHNPTFYALIQTGAAADIANIRIWIGLVAAAVANVDAAGTSCVAFRYSTVAADPGFVAVTNDGAVQNVSGLVANGTIAATTNYLLKIRLDINSGTAYAIFTINDGTETTTTVNLPAAATELGFQVRIVTTNAVGKNMAISYAWMELN